MKKTFDVIIDKLQGITFPSHCVVCKRPHNDQHGIIELTPGGAYWHHLVTSLDYITSKTHVLSIPGHTKCLKSMRTSFWLRWLLLFLIIISCVIYGAVNDWNRFQSIVIGLIIAAPLIIWQVTHPLPIEYSQRSGKYIFSFSDRKYAELFAALNNAKIEEKR